MNFLKFAWTFFTWPNVIQVVVFGTAGGLVYVICTHVYVKQENPWIKLGSRCLRRTVSYAYPFALVLFVSNVVFNYSTNKPIFKKFPILEKLFGGLATQKVQQSGALTSVGWYCLSFYSFIFTCTACLPLYYVYQSFQKHPFFQVKFLLSCFVAQWLYTLYVDWVKENDEAFVYKSLKELQKEDSIHGFFKIPHIIQVLAEDFSQNTTQNVFSSIRFVKSLLNHCSWKPPVFRFQNLRAFTSDSDNTWDFEDIIDFDLVVINE